jgi:mono/diheme cytochrome c family protein
MGQYHFDSPVPAVAWMQRIIGLLLLGLLLLFYYRRTLNPVAGGTGVLLTLGSAFHFQSLLSLLARPEHGLFHTAPLPFLHAIQPLIWTGIFLAAAGVFTGATILLLLFRWPERPIETPVHQRPKLSNLARGHIVAGALALPPLLLWDLYTAPSYQMEPLLLRASLWTIGLLLLMAWIMLRMMRPPSTGQAWLLFLLSLGLFGLLTGRQQLATAAATREHTLRLQARIELAREDLLAARENLYASSMEIDPALGQQIFTQRCTACHSFATPGLGPAYNDVLPRYLGDLEGLTQFIWRPVKVNPEYPAMPGQGLRRSEARAVADYLLDVFTAGPGDPP